MGNISRRSFIGGVAAIPFAVWLREYAGAAQPATTTRFDARSTQGQAMLKTYAAAVSKMKNTAEGDPRSWVFQWYTHWVKGPFGPGPKQSELARIYPNASDPRRKLAQEMWDTCQAHGPGEDENFFLPWHRMYVYFFERLVRSMSGVKTFTLPYWNYSAAGATVHGIVPQQFRQPKDPTFNVLFVSNRNARANNGQAIDAGQPGNPLGLGSLAECGYGPQGVRQGFCAALDFGLHGNVHVLVGNQQNMGNVPTAAGDPIFWMHHSNIDRLWASWNRAGRSNPTTQAFLSKQFIFADENGNRVQATVQDFLNIAKLGYTYDRFETAPACPAAGPGVVAAPAPKRHAAVTAPITLGVEPVRVALEPPPEAKEAAPSLVAPIQALGGSRRVYLVVKKLVTETQPGVLYHVYLDLPSGAKPDNAHYAGSVNFFHAGAHGDHGAAPAQTEEEKFLSFDVTQTAKNLASKKLLSDKPTLTIVPGDKPNADAKPVIGEVSLVEQ